MFCKFCGKELLEQAEICPNCGCRLKQRGRNAFAVVAFILSLIIPVYGFVPGIIFGSIGLSFSKKRDGAGKGLSIAAIIISCVWLALLVILMAVAVYMPE